MRALKNYDILKERPNWKAWPQFAKFQEFLDVPLFQSFERSIIIFRSYSWKIWLVDILLSYAHVSLGRGPYEERFALAAMAYGLTKVSVGSIWKYV